MYEPMLGIFWYDDIKCQLIGVHMMPENQITPDGQGKGLFLFCTKKFGKIYITNIIINLETMFPMNITWKRTRAHMLK